MATRKTTPRSAEKAAPAAKTTSRGRSSAESAGARERAPLASPMGIIYPTENPKVWRNVAGVLVDRNGIILGFAQMRAHEDEETTQVLGHPVATPAQYLKAVALDPRVPMETRIDAAKAAAPYTDRKQPLAIDGGVNPDTGKAVPLGQEVYEGFSKEQIALLKTVFEAKKGEPT